MINFDPFEDMWKRDSYVSLRQMICMVPLLCLLYAIILIWYLGGKIIYFLIDIGDGTMYRKMKRKLQNKSK
jgi:hypothetical protein